MDYEKLYNEALERARQIHTTNGDEHKKSTEYIFPELKVNEDEKIRENCIHFLELQKAHCAATFAIDECIAWIEKQDKTTDNINVEEMVLRYSQTRDGSWGLPVNCQIKAYRQGILDAVNMFGIKQSEQKLQGNTDPAETNEEQVDNANEGEPKFKVGDWITNRGNSYLIAAIEDNMYLFEIGGYTNEKLNWDTIENVDKHYHLWTIQDALDCDILVNGSNIFIFSHISGTRVMGYCHINLDNKMVYDDKGKNECFGLIDAVFTPATREQRGYLFSTLFANGYTWDICKQEIKKSRDYQNVVVLSKIYHL